MPHDGHDVEAKNDDGAVASAAPRSKRKAPKEKAKVKDIWAKLLDEDASSSSSTATNAHAASASSDAYVLVCGQRGSGKSTLTSLFVGASSSSSSSSRSSSSSTDEVKPTTALAYAHCTRDGASGAARCVFFSL